MNANPAASSIGAGALAYGQNATAAGQAAVVVQNATTGPITTNLYLDGAQAHALQAMLAQVMRPALSDFCNFVQQPDQVLPALYASQAQPLLPAHRVAYRPDLRQGAEEVQPALARQLFAPLLLVGNDGQGRTREIGELARAQCGSGWTICLVKPMLSGRLGPVAGLPAAHKLLIVIDDLPRHQLNDTPGQATFLQRLNNLLAQLRQDPNLDVALIASSDRALALDGWQAATLPDFSDDGLAALLTQLVEQTNVALVADAAELVAASDGTPKTIIENVRAALRSGAPLAQSSWEASWRAILIERFQAVVRRSRQAATHLFRAVLLLQQANLPARRPTVMRLAAGWGSDVGAAIEQAVDQHALVLSDDTLRPHDGSQIALSLASVGQTPPDFASSIGDLIATLCVAEMTADDREDLLQLARTLLDRNHYAAAVTLLDHLLLIDPQNGRGYRLRGEAQWQQRAYDKAEADLSQAAALADDGFPLLLLGFMRLSAGNYEAARDDFSMAIAQGLTLGYGGRAFAHTMLADFDAAEEDLSVVLEEEPDNAPMRTSRASVRYARGDFAGALDDLNRLVAQGEDGYLIFQTRGWLHLMLRNYSDALSDLNRTIEMQPDVPYLYSLRALAQFYLDQYAEALADYTVAIDRWQEDRTIALIAELHARVNGGDDGALRAWLSENWEALLQALPLADVDLDPAEAGMVDFLLNYLTGWFRNVLPKQWQQQSMVAALYAGRGSCRYFLQQHDAALADLDQAIELVAGEGAFFKMRALAHIEKQQWQLALADADEALRLQHEHVWSYYARGLAAAALDQAEQAQTDLGFAIANGAEDARAHLGRAVAYTQLERLDDAEADYSWIVDRGVAGGLIYLWRGSVRLNTDDVDGALADFNTAHELEVDHADLFLLRGATHYLLGQYEPAIADYGRAIDDQAEGGNPLAGRAMASLRSGKVKQAEADCRRAAELLPDNYSSLECEGDLLLYDGDAAAAADRYAAAVEQMPGPHLLCKGAISLSVIGQQEAAQHLFELLLQNSSPLLQALCRRELLFWQPIVAPDAGDYLLQVAASFAAVQT